MKLHFRKTLAGLVGGMLLLTSLPATTLSHAGAASDCVIDSATTYQHISGFGGINLPEWAGSDMSQEQVQKAFGNGEDELGFTILRTFINDNKNQWNIAVPTAKAAQQLGATVFASPWNPPSSIAESGGSNGAKHVRTDSYAAYAQHLNDYYHYMKDNGVDIYAISVQNEPDYAHEWTYWSSDETTTFLANYADKIDCKVMSPETFQYTNKDYYSKILNNSKAMANCDLFGTHFYGTQRSQMDFAALENSGKEIWMTEVYVPNSNQNSANNWPEALDVAKNMHNGLVVGNMSAYVWWYIRRHYGPMTDDGKISKRGYMMAQYSKYVRPDAYRIGCTEAPANNLQISAYKNTDGSIAIVAINTGTSAVTQNFSVNSGERISSVDAIRSSGSENLKQSTVSFNGNSFSASLPGQSVTTFVLATDGGSSPISPAEPNEDGSYFIDTFESSVGTWSGRGSASVELSDKNAYEGSKALFVSGREATWNGAVKSLSTGIFKPGETYSFSACVSPASSNDTSEYMLSLQYTDASGETQYSHIASGASIGGEYVLLSNTAYMIPNGASDLQLYVESVDGMNDFYIDRVIGATEGSVFEGPKPVQFLLGDADYNGAITASDLTIAKRIILGSETGSAAIKAADVNQDKRVSVSDLVWYVKFLTGQVSDYPEKGAVVDGDEPPVTAMRTISEYTPIVEAAVSEFETNDSKQEKAGVSYGTVKSGSYYSTTCNRNKPYNILLPAGYSESKQYPVLYVMHGYWENQDRMILTGNNTMYTRQIIGNAIASGDAEDMIVVFPYIYSSATQAECSGMDDANNRAYDNFINDLVKDLMPHIESTYSIKTGRENTAITGFSMGGRESLLIGMQRADLFGYVGAICAAPGVTGSFKWNSEEEAPSLVFLTAGSNDDVVYTTPNSYHENFTKNNVPHIWHYVNGGYHGDNSIHAHLYNFVRAVFKA